MLDCDLIELIEKYDTRVPRYTSYPTVVELAAPVENERIKAALGAALGMPLSLYVHLPFCSSPYSFCACSQLVTQDVSVASEYLEDLRRELDLLLEYSGGRHTVAAVHLQGGYPTFLPPDQLSGLCGLLRERFIGFDLATKSIELDPRTTTSGQIEQLREQGFTRASLGVQDVDPSVQEQVHRAQPFEQVAGVTRNLRDRGFNTINFNLIHGLPGQSQDLFKQTIERVVELAPDRIALYDYAQVQWNTKVQKVFDKQPLPSSRERIELFSIAEELLLCAGYLAIGIDHFTLPTDELAIHAEQGGLHRNFMGYTTRPGQGVLGIGVSSVSDIAGTLYQNEVELDHYVAAVRGQKLPVAKARHRTRDDEVRAFLIERIMCDGQIRLDSLPPSLAEEARYIIADAIPVLEPLIQDGLVAWDDDEDVLHATFNGRYFIRCIAAAFDA